MCDLLAQCRRVDVVDERAPSVDLDDRQPLAIRLLERRVAADVDLRQLEPELAPNAGDDGSRALAQVAAGGVVEADLARYG